MRFQVEEENQSPTAEVPREGSVAAPAEADGTGESVTETVGLRGVIEQWESWAIPLASAVFAALVALAVVALVSRVVKRFTIKHKGGAIWSVVRSLLPAGRVAAAAMAALFVVRSALLQAGPGAAAVLSAVRQGLSITVILAMAWMAVRLMKGAVNVLLARHDIKVSDNYQARRVHTQWAVITGIGTALIWIIGIATALMTFESIRHLGTSILASAGLAGLVVGLAAQRVIGNFLAGLQIAMTQPIAIDDVVVIEGEWGKVEEITPTYVVVKIWDDRRLIVPFNHIIEQPFTNWTRRTSQILGTAEFYADFGAPVQELREELGRFVKTQPKWDGRAWGLQVTDATERSMKLRALVSAANAGDAFDLRCAVREHMLTVMRERYMNYLTRVRVEGGEEEPAGAAHE